MIKENYLLLKARKLIVLIVSKILIKKLHCSLCILFAYTYYIISYHFQDQIALFFELLELFTAQRKVAKNVASAYKHMLSFSLSCQLSFVVHLTFNSSHNYLHSSSTTMSCRIFTVSGSVEVF